MAVTRSRMGIMAIRTFNEVFSAQRLLSQMRQLFGMREIKTVVKNVVLVFVVFVLTNRVRRYSFHNSLAL